MKNGVLSNFTRSHISSDRVRSGYEIRGPIRINGLNCLPLWAESVFDGAGTVFIGVDMALLDKMDPRRANSAPGAIEVNRHFGAETDLLNLHCKQKLSFDMCARS